ncbi:hypothetical protein HF668_03600 [Acidithiobacillus ferridurans]|uniref:hypothetical protein n=1 Tax=Acidithiobacillus ferridurans TaxID=1232575 RepID=UPI001C06FAAF|nr:hypothetical protein [Acidithiobacillus ferridurans]MBU2804254.1 hypothetical protein [Acidithiobacillus ferridurans]
MQDQADATELPQKRRGRPRVHKDRQAAQRAASAAYRARKRARRQTPTIESAIIDLSAVATYKVKGRAQFGEPTAASSYPYCLGDVDDGPDHRRYAIRQPEECQPKGKPESRAQQPIGAPKTAPEVCTVVVKYLGNGCTNPAVTAFL